MRTGFIYLLLLAALGGLLLFKTHTAAPEQEGVDTMPAEYHFPAEELEHEGTWLTWPHNYTYGQKYRDEIEDIWMKMAAALHTSEKVFIIAYDKAELNRIKKLLQSEKLDMTQVDFVIARSDDVWVRDTGPMFVLDKDGKPVIADFAFDGWGEKAPYQNDDSIAQTVAASKGFSILSSLDFVLEGGSVEMDGKGTVMLCKSSVVSESRNPTLSTSEAEAYLTQYLGAANFIWLEGVVGEDITDAHIDGMARFIDDHTILTVSKADFFELYEGIVASDYDTLLNAKNAKGESYSIAELPLTAKNVKGLDYKGSYLNYYVGNEVVLIPVYGDPNDAAAVSVLSKLYTDREIVPIDVTALYRYGGMLHCITQQQPKDMSAAY